MRADTIVIVVCAWFFVYVFLITIIIIIVIFIIFMSAIHSGGGYIQNRFVNVPAGPPSPLRNVTPFLRILSLGPKSLSWCRRQLMIHCDSHLLYFLVLLMVLSMSYFISTYGEEGPFSLGGQPS